MFPYIGVLTLRISVLGGVVGADIYRFTHVLYDAQGLFYFTAGRRIDAVLLNDLLRGGVFFAFPFYKTIRMQDGNLKGLARTRYEDLIVNDAVAGGRINNVIRVAD